MVLAESRTVLLWDIDGTLLSTGRAGVFALEAAAEHVLGRPVDLQDMHTSGLTDAQIAELILEEHGAAPTPEDIATFLDVYAAALPGVLHRRQGRVMAGVPELLADLEADPRVLNLLLTGNVAAGAKAKLAHYGLDGWLSTGAFCEGPGQRAEIARRALAVAAARLGTEPDRARTFVVGDTPHDVRCGTAVGVRTIAVASGAHGVEELERAGAWVVLPALPAPAAFRRLLGV